MTYSFDTFFKLFESIDQDAIDKTVRELNAHPRIFVYGAGRSGLMLKAFAMRLAQAGRTVYAVGEVVTPAIEAEDILILASASGETASVIRSAQTARTIGVSVFAITARTDSTLASLSDTVVHIPSPTKDNADESSIMGTLFEEALLLFCDAATEKLGVDAKQMRARHANLE